jgi:hypothetical protein
MVSAAVPCPSSAGPVTPPPGSDQSCTSVVSKPARSSAVRVSRTRRQPRARTRHAGSMMPWTLRVRPCPATCSSRSSVPSGARIRRSSRAAASTSGTEQSTSVETSVSIDASSTGRSAALPATTETSRGSRSRSRPTCAPSRSRIGPEGSTRVRWDTVLGRWGRFAPVPAPISSVRPRGPGEQLGPGPAQTRSLDACEDGVVGGREQPVVGAAERGAEAAREGSGRASASLLLGRSPARPCVAPAAPGP